MIVRGTIQVLRHFFPESQITVSSIDDTDCGHYGEDVWVAGLHTDFMKQRKSKAALVGSFAATIVRVAMDLLGYKLFHRSPRLPFVRACADSQVVLALGGGYLYGRSWCNFLLSLATLQTAILLSKPLILASQTIGPFRGHYLQGRLLRKLLQQKEVKEIHVREKKSLRLLHKWGLARASQLAPDLAWAFGYLRTKESKRKDSPRDAGKNAKQILGFTVRRWFRDAVLQSSYEKNVTKALEYFARRGMRIAAVIQVDAPNLGDSDVLVTDRVINKLSNAAQQQCVRYNPDSPETMMELMAGFSLFLGTRMHSNILALLSGVPVVAIEYQYKTAGIMESLGIGEYVVPIRDAKPDRLLKLLDKAHTFREAYLQKVEPRITLMAEQSVHKLQDAVEHVISAGQERTGRG